MVDDRMHRVDAQSIDMKFVDPLQRVVNEKPANVVAMWPVEIDRHSPWRLVAIGEIRCEFREVIPFRTEVVVDDVEEKREAALVTGIDEPLQSDRTAIRDLCRADVRAVISPISIAGKLANGKELDCGDAEIFQ